MTDNLRRQLEAARRTAATWQSKYNKLLNEFQAYKLETEGSLKRWPEPKKATRDEINYECHQSGAPF